MSRVLVVEPDAILANIYQEALEREGFKVNHTISAQAGITEADQSCPDIILLELQLVEHSGIEFLYELRSYPEWQDIPVIIHTTVPPGEFSDSWELMKNELGVCFYLYKPHTSLRKLLSTVKQYTPVTS